MSPTAQQLEALQYAVGNRVTWAYDPADNGAGLDFLVRQGGRCLRFWTEDAESGLWQIIVFNDPRIRVVQASAQVQGIEWDGLAVIADAMLRDLARVEREANRPDPESPGMTPVEVLLQAKRDNSLVEVTMEDGGTYHGWIETLDEETHALTLGDADDLAADLDLSEVIEASVVEA